MTIVCVFQYNSFRKQSISKGNDYSNDTGNTVDIDLSEIDTEQAGFTLGQHVCLVNIDNTIHYTFLKESDIVDAPTKNEILGTISKLTLGESPDEHEETNFPECLNQEYAYIDGKLILHILYPLGTEGNWYLLHTVGN